MDRLKRKPFAAQAEVVQAITALLLDRNEQAGIINAEMGIGKTMMAIAVAAVMHAAGYRRTLVVSPPHLVYKWRREILETIPDARVWVLNGPDTLLKLLKPRDQMGDAYDGRQEFFILGHVRMRMGFHWRLACIGYTANIKITPKKISAIRRYFRWLSAFIFPPNRFKLEH